MDAARYLFIAGGIGITPIHMIAAAEAAGADWELVYGGRQRASMAFLDELAAVYWCGPEPLLAAVEARCTTWPKGSLHVERFVPKPLSAPVLTEAFEVHLAKSGMTVTVPTDESILSVL